MRQSSATSRRGLKASSPTCWTDATSVFPTRVTNVACPPAGTVRCTAPVTRSTRTSAWSMAGALGSPVTASHAASASAVIQPGWPGVGSVAVMPAVVAVSPVSRVASTIDPPIATTSETTTTTTRHRRQDSRRGVA